MEQETSHFQIVYGQLVGLEQSGDCRREGHTPNCGVKSFTATEPDATGPKFAGITEAHEVRPARDQLGAFGWAVGHKFEHGAEICES